MEQLFLKPKILTHLKQSKSLLAFSYGIDSTALFYLLLQNSIDFDIAIVNYQTREQSFIEESEARILANKFNKKIFVLQAKLDLENSSNFEKRARDIRHNFFLETALKFSYKNIVFAHQLNDMFEWFLMQLSRGSGLTNLISMQELQRKNEIFYVRPLLEFSKDELLAFLQNQNLKYFIDSSNSDEKFTRNYIRANFANAFLNEFKSGIKRSFEILQGEKELMLGEFIYEKDEFFIVEKSKFCINLIDKACKKLGVVISQKQRDEILKSDCVISSKITICSNEKFYFITNFEKTSMPKKFKERCRVLKIPKLLRSSLLQREEIFKFFT